MRSIDQLLGDIPSFGRFELDPEGYVCRLLVFEDIKTDFDKIIRSLQDLSSKRKVFEVIRLKNQPKFPPDGHPGREWKKLIFSDKYSTFRLTYTLNGNQETREVERSEWWPGDFDAAILDVYMEKIAGPVGAKYARWFKDANFTGPIVLMSVGQIPLLTGLPNIDYISKSDDENWHDLVAERIDTRIERFDDPIPTVGIHGRRPDNALADFFDENEHAPSECTALWVNRRARDTDYELLDYVFDYLMVNNAARSLGDTSVNFHDVENIAKKEGVDHLWIGCGEVIDNKTVDSVINIQGEIDSLIPVFIAKRRDNIDNEKFRILRSMCSIFVNRVNIDNSPTLWLRNSVLRLANACQHWKYYKDSFEKVTKLRYAESIFRSYIPLYISARTKSAVAGTSGSPSLARWFSPSPLEAFIFNKGFDPLINNAIDKLIDNYILDGEVVRYTGLRRERKDS